MPDKVFDKPHPPKRWCEVQPEKSSEFPIQMSVPPYEDFLGIAEEDIPELSQILDAVSQDPGEVREPDDLCKSCLAFLEGIASTCGLEIIVAELSVIQDPRLLIGRSPYFVTVASAITGDAENSTQLLNEYLAAVRRMARIGSVIGDSGFHDVPYYWYTASTATPVEATPEDGAHAQLRKPMSFCGRFELPTHQSVRNSSHHVQDFFSDFTTRAPFPLPRRSSLLVVPIQRPAPKELHDEGSYRSRKTAPAGALFIVANTQKPDFKKADVENCALRFKYALTKAVLREASGHLDVKLAQSSLMSNMCHGTVTAIRSISSGNLRATIFKRGTDELQFSICDEEGSPIPDIEAQLIRAVKIVEMGENVAAAMTTLAELVVVGGFVLRKYQNDEQVTMRSLIENAFDLVNANAVGKPLGVLSRVECIWNGMEPSSWLIPGGYLHKDILLGLLLEVLKNASRYGVSGEDGVVRVIVALQSREEGGLVLSALTPISQIVFDDRWEQVPTTDITIPSAAAQSGRAGFLTRLALFTRDFPGISVKCKRESYGGHPYCVTELGFGRVTVECERTATGQTHVIPILVD